MNLVLGVLFLVSAVRIAIHHLGWGDLSDNSYAAERVLLFLYGISAYILRKLDSILEDVKKCKESFRSDLSGQRKKGKQKK